MKIERATDGSGLVLTSATGESLQVSFMEFWDICKYGDYIDTKDEVIEYLNDLDDINGYSAERISADDALVDRLTEAVINDRICSESLDQIYNAAEKLVKEIQAPLYASIAGTEPSVLPENRAMHPKTLSKESILASILADGNLAIESSNASGMTLWDEEDEKAVPVHFLEAMNPSVLAGKIFVSKDIPSKYQLDKEVLAKYLWDVCDKNAFITLDELVVIWSEPEDPESFEPADFIDEQSKRMYDKHCDEYALEIGDGLLGQLWFERNTVIINMGEIVRTSASIAEENRDLSSYFSLENQVQMGFYTTVIHELRHLQMDTNLFLPEEIYPTALSAEAAVEDYCRELYESSPVPSDVFTGLFGGRDVKPSLDAAIKAAEDRTKPDANAQAPDLNERPL